MRVDLLDLGVKLLGADMLAEFKEYATSAQRSAD
jgi:hypothetical protein